MPTILCYRGFRLARPIVVQVQIEPDTATFETTIAGEDTWTTRISWSGLLLRNDRCGFDRWSFPIGADGRHGRLLNIHAETALTKLAVTEFCQQRDVNLLFHVITRPEDQSLMDCMYFVNVPDDAELRCNRPMIEGPRVITTGQKFYWPALSLSELSRDADGVVVGITMPPNVSNQDIYLKCDVGLVPRKVTVRHGEARFRFTPIGMTGGDVSTIKAGFEFYSNIAAINVTWGT